MLSADPSEQQIIQSLPEALQKLPGVHARRIPRRTLVTSSASCGEGRRAEDSTSTELSASFPGQLGTERRLRVASRNARSRTRSGRQAGSASGARGPVMRAWSEPPASRRSIMCRAGRSTAFCHATKTKALCPLDRRGDNRQANPTFQRGRGLDGRGRCDRYGVGPCSRPVIPRPG